MAPLSALLLAATYLLSSAPASLVLPGLGDDIARHLAEYKKKPSTASDGVRDGGLANEFPDPALLFADNTWWSFATSTCDGLMPVASSTDFKTWAFVAGTAIDSTTFGGGEIWAPDVIAFNGGYLMAFTDPYYEDSRLGKNVKHACIFTATASAPQGPYSASKGPVICPKAGDLEVIDPAFYQESGKLYIVHKKSKFNGKEKVWTNIDLQPLNSAGDGLDGSASTLLRDDKSDGTSHNIEAPYIVKHDDLYFLTFSSHEFSGPAYDTKYAVSTSLIKGYKRRGSVVHTGSFQSWGGSSGSKLTLNGPGGLSFSSGGSKAGHFVFHNRQGTTHCETTAGQVARRLWTGNAKFSKANGGTISL